MAELLDEASQLESTTVGVYRTAATIKGGRRFSFSSLVVVGDRHGQVGFGYGKANEVPPAIEKAQKDARKSLNRITLHGGTIPHQVTGRFGASEVRLIPASPGTGVVAGSAVRAVLDMVGVTDCLSKCYGSTNPQNVVKATVDGLRQLTAKTTIAELRGVEINRTEVDELLDRGAAFMPSSGADRPKAKAPTNTVGEGRGGGRAGRGGRGGGARGGRGGGRGRGPAESAPQTDSAASGATDASGGGTEGEKSNS